MRRVETPLTTISIKARIRAFSLRWYRFEQLRREGAAASPRNPKLEGADTRFELPLPIAVAMPRSLISPLVWLCFEMFAHLGFQHLMEHRLKELADSLIAMKKLMLFTVI